MDTSRAVTRILGVNALAIGGGMAAQFVRWVAGVASPLMGVYAGLTATLLILCLGCMWFAGLDSKRALLVYGWSALFVVMSMVALDAACYPDTLPSLVYAPLVGVLAIGALVGFWPMFWYSLVYLVFAISAGLYYEASEMGPVLIVCVAGASVAIAIMEHVAYLDGELENLRGLITRYCDVKTSIRRNG